MPSTTIPKTILLTGDPLAGEALGAGAITPGMLLERDSGGTVSVHSVAGAVAAAMFAREEEYVGGGIDTAYASGDRIPYYIGRSGDQFYAFLEDGQSVVIGENLESNGAGALQPIGTAGSPVVRALEAVSTVGGAAAIARIKVEVI